MIEYKFKYSPSELLKYNVIVRRKNYIKAILLYAILEEDKKYINKVGIIKDFSTSLNHAKFIIGNNSMSKNLKFLNILK